MRTGTSASQPSGIRLSWTQDATNTTMTIMWETDSSGNPNAAQYGLTSTCELGTSYGFSFADSWGILYNHQVELTDLSPNTKYFYKVSGDSGEWSNVYNFTTAPDSAINWTFLVAADSRTNYNDWNSVVQAMAANFDARLLFFGGDILSDFDSQSQWYEWMNPAQPLISHVPFISSKGNHEDDVTGDPWDNYLNTFAFPSNEEYFSFDYGNAHFIVLNSLDSYDTAQKLWLESDLQAATSNQSDPWIFVSFHGPPYSSGGHDSSTSARANFVPLLRDYGVDMVFSGHNHFYQRTYPLNTTDIDNPLISDYEKDFYYYPDPMYITAGRAGAPSYTPNNDAGWFVEDRMSSANHYMKIDIYTNGSLHATTRYTDNIIFDDFWIIKNGTAPPPKPPPPPTEIVEFIPRGDNWRYDVTDPQIATIPPWNEPGFDDSSWSEGPAPLGFGDSVTYGTVLPDNDGSYYFRNNFTLDPGTEVLSATLGVASDNYAIVYLNGILIDDDSGANHEFSYWNRYINLQPSDFQVGENIVAVYVYNTAGSSDAYMDLEIKATVEDPNSMILYPGWNLISIPYLQAETNVGVVLSSITGSYDAVQWFDGSTWSHNHTLKSPQFNELDSLDHTIGFWIHITEPSGIQFTYPDLQPALEQSISINKGWNMVGYPSLTNYNRTLGLNNLDFGTQVDAIQWYDAGTQSWNFMGPGEEFVPGRGYWMHSNVDANWDVPL